MKKKKSIKLKKKKTKKQKKKKSLKIKKKLKFKITEKPKGPLLRTEFTNLEKRKIKNKWLKKQKI